MDNKQRTKILFLIKDFKHGGIPRVLVNLLDCLAQNEFNIDVFVSNPIGIFEKQCTNCHLLPHSEILRILCCNYRLQHGFEYLKCIFIKFLRAICKLLLKTDLLDIVTRKIGSKLSNQYDVVWACSEETPAKIAQGIKAKRHILWIHSDYSSCYDMIRVIGFPNYLAYDKIICVSKHGAKSFIDTLKNKQNLDLSDRVDVLYNIVNYQEILSQSTKYPDNFELNQDTFNIVSVGRLAWEKQYEAIPDIISKINIENIKFKWYIIGDGAQEMITMLHAEIAKYQVEDKLILLGVKSNPYPYIARANLMVITSRFESYPTVISEAMVLGTPIICSDFQGASECLPPEDGIICSINEMPQHISQQIRNNPVRCLQDITYFEERNQEVIQKFKSIVS